ncbi:MAG TPA: FtsX-like permease family protein [Chloroflexia bacterium]|nr:FtsX-like permease family protein [Chloroflexia bacterium]
MESLFGIPMDNVMVFTLGMTIFVLLIVAFLAWRKPILARLALRNIPRRRAQTALIVLGLMLATLLITAAFGTGDTLTYSIRGSFTASLGNTDIQVHKVNPIINFGGPPDFNRPVPTLPESVYTDLKAKVGSDERIDGWSATMQQTGAVINTTARQVSGQTFIIGIDPESRTTFGDLVTPSGQVLDEASITAGDLVIDQAAADKLDAKIGHDVNVMIAGKPVGFKVSAIVQNSSPSTMFPVTFMRLDRMQEIFSAPGQITDINISLKGDKFEGVKYSGEVAGKLKGLVDTKTYTVEEVKKDAIETANLFGNLFTTLFVATSLFSIAAGILLIFLIFTMLAAERKSEMGMARAVGIQRGDLTQTFVFEGLAYDLAAAAIGAALGVALSFLMVGIISGIVGTFGFSLTPHIELRSVVVAYCIGTLITFLTVAISASRVSRLNIVAAIRDIPDAHKADPSLRHQLTEPFNQLGQRRPLGCIGAIFSLIASLLKSGPVTGTLGVLLFILGWATNNGLYFHLGASLTLIALGMTLRWILTRRGVRPARRNRIAFTFAGLALLAYWILPIDVLHDWIGAPAFGDDGITNVMFIGGIMMVLGAVWVVMYNSDILLGALTKLLGRSGRMRPVLKTAVAYPMSSIFRTGMAIAMFSLIIFVLIAMSVLFSINQQIDPNKPEVSGGYDIQATISFNNPIPDIRQQIESNPNLKGKFSSIAGQTLVPLEMRQLGTPQSSTPSGGWRFYNTRFADDTFLGDNQFSLSVRAKGYETDRQVWDAVLNDPTLVVVDILPVVIGSAGGAGGAGPNILTISGVDPGNPVMEPVDLEFRAPGALGIPGLQPAKVKVIGVLNRNANFYIGMYANKKLATDLLPPQMLQGLTGNASLTELPTTNYFFRVASSAGTAQKSSQVQELRRELGSAFLDNGLEPVVIADQLRTQLALSQSLGNLLQGFLALGLFVGVAALGVISTRAVVERRQQIGVLRAIGYQRNMVGLSFLLESSFIALLGILIGVVLGLILSYNMVQFIRKDTPTVEYIVPFGQIGLIVVLAYVVSLITTILPARSASKIYPAEALRYE